MTSGYATKNSDHNVALGTRANCFSWICRHALERMGIGLMRSISIKWPFWWECLPRCLLFLNSQTVRINSPLIESQYCQDRVRPFRTCCEEWWSWYWICVLTFPLGDDSERVTTATDSRIVPEWTAIEEKKMIMLSCKWSGQEDCQPPSSRWQQPMGGKNRSCDYVGPTCSRQFSIHRTLLVFRRQICSTRPVPTLVSVHRHFKMITGSV